MLDKIEQIRNKVAKYLIVQTYTLDQIIFWVLASSVLGVIISLTHLGIL